MTALGYELVQSVGYGDHQAFDAAELLARFGQRPLLMTEKDAVKCRPFAPDNWWYLPVSAELPDALGEALLRTLGPQPGGTSTRRPDGAPPDWNRRPVPGLGGWPCTLTCQARSPVGNR